MRGCESILIAIMLVMLAVGITGCAPKEPQKFGAVESVKEKLENLIKARGGTVSSWEVKGVGSWEPLLLTWKEKEWTANATLYGPTPEELEEGWWEPSCGIALKLRGKSHAIERITAVFTLYAKATESIGNDIWGLLMKINQEFAPNASEDFNFLRECYCGGRPLEKYFVFQYKPQWPPGSLEDYLKEIIPESPVEFCRLMEFTLPPFQLGVECYFDQENTLFSVSMGQLPEGIGFQLRAQFMYRGEE